MSTATGGTLPEFDVPAWIRGLIFDCDGTLVDTLPLHYAAWEETFAEWGLSCPLEFLLRHNGKPTDLIVALYNAEFSQALDIKKFTEDKERRTYALLDQAQHSLTQHFKVQSLDGFGCTGMSAAICAAAQPLSSSPLRSMRRGASTLTRAAARSRRSTMGNTARVEAYRYGAFGTRPDSIDETTDVATVEDDKVADVNAIRQAMPFYGPLKARCEAAAEAAV